MGMLGPGTLYGAIKRLKEGGVIEESGQKWPDPGEAPDDERRRRYYRLTGFGGEVLAAEVRRCARGGTLPRLDEPCRWTHRD